MRAVVVLGCLGACTFKPGSLVADDTVDPAGDAHATDAPASLVDAAPADAAVDAPDAPVGQPSTTNHLSVADTHLCETGPNTNYNGQESTLVDGPGNRCVIAMRFDLSSIPTNAVVSSAQLDLWVDYDSGGASTVYALAESWVESEASWNSRSNGVAWMTAGAGVPSRGTTVFASFPVSNANTEYKALAATAIVQGWVTTPGTNNGIVFTTADPDGTRWSTRENGTATLRPVLHVTHTP